MGTGEVNYQVYQETMILLDPGHGYNTKGKRSPVWKDGSQLFEWEFTRDVVRRLHGKLMLYDVPSMVLVREAYDVSLQERVDRANRIYKESKNTFVVSIHGNAAPKEKQGRAEGWEVWTAPKQTESDKIATIIYDQACITLKDFKMRHDYFDGDPDKEAKFKILIDTKCPAVLTENLFYDNEKECKFMLSDFGRETIANLHLFAILRYLQLKGLYHL